MCNVDTLTTAVFEANDAAYVAGATTRTPAQVAAVAARDAHTDRCEDCNRAAVNEAAQDRAAWAALDA